MIDVLNEFYLFIFLSLFIYLRVCLVGGGGHAAVNQEFTIVSWQHGYEESKERKKVSGMQTCESAISSCSCCPRINGNENSECTEQLNETECRRERNIQINQS